MILAFDTETTGFMSFKQPLDHPTQPDVIQIAAILAEEDDTQPHGYREHAVLACLVDPTPINPGWRMSEGAEACHGISRERVEAEGVPAPEVLATFEDMWASADVHVCHNTQFDSRIMGVALCKVGAEPRALQIMNATSFYCTMKRSTDLCKLPGRYGNYKWPKLSELHEHLFGEGFEGAHDALADVRATLRCYFEMRRRGL